MRTKNGDHNSYQSSDAINQIKWADKDKYEEVFEFYQGMIEYRKKHLAFSLGDAELVRKHLVFYGNENLPLDDKNLVAFLLTDHAGGDEAGTIFVAYNANRTPISVPLPQGKWSLDIYGDEIYANPMNESFNAIDVPPLGMVVMTSSEVLQAQIIQEDIPEVDLVDDQPVDTPTDYTGIYINLGLLLIGAVTGIWWIRKNKKK
jgi:pullulanase